MTAPMSPDIAIAAMRQERLKWIDARAAAEDKIRTLDAQIAGAVFVMDLQAKAAVQLDESPATPEPKGD